MARRGMGGMDMGAMMKQLQKVQAEMAEAQEKLAQEVVESAVGGGAVKVKFSGDLRLLEIKIDPDAVDPEETDVLEDLVAAAVNEGLRAAQELANQRIGGAAGLGGGALGGLGLPGM
jgi:DNA-binding YbaB/EbfC family protein